MPELVCELIVSLDGFARGQRSPGYFGYFGPDFADWIKTNTAVPHRMLVGRRTYEALEGLPAEVRGRLENDDDNAGLAVLAHSGDDKLAGAESRSR
jgi:hypothetical protein